MATLIRGSAPAIILACLLVAVTVLGCQPDPPPGPFMVENDLDREVSIWYEVDGVESIQQARNGRMSIRPELFNEYWFGLADDATTHLCTDGTIRARAGDEVVAVIPPPVCTQGRTIFLSEWPP